ncbi:MAG TPA: hypothetical protein VFK14_02065 [Solirubrobacterales bacterium]|nr:hypothetical protein [Solirubrobacterales bacterium]
MSFVNPLTAGSLVLVAAVGQAEGARAAAAALSCAVAAIDASPLFVDVGGRQPRPALLASAAAQKLEERVGAHLPAVKVAARGQVCHLSVPADVDGLASAAAAATVARGAMVVLHLPPELLGSAVAGAGGLRPSGALLRADLAADRPLVALAVRGLLGEGLAVGVLKHRLGWVAERRALFGALPAGAAGGLSDRLVRRLGLSRDTEIRFPVPAAV